MSLDLCSLVLTSLTDPKGLKVTKNAYLSLLAQSKKLLSYDTSVEIGVTFWTHRKALTHAWMEEQTDL